MSTTEDSYSSENPPDSLSRRSSLAKLKTPSAKIPLSTIRKPLKDKNQIHSMEEKLAMWKKKKGAKQQSAKPRKIGQVDQERRFSQVPKSSTSTQRRWTLQGDQNQNASNSSEEGKGIKRSIADEETARKRMKSQQSSGHVLAHTLNSGVSQEIQEDYDNSIQDTQEINDKVETKDVEKTQDIQETQHLENFELFGKTEALQLKEQLQQTEVKMWEAEQLVLRLTSALRECLGQNQQLTQNVKDLESKIQQQSNLQSTVTHLSLLLEVSQHTIDDLEKKMEQASQHKPNDQFRPLRSSRPSLSTDSTFPDPNLFGRLRSHHITHKYDKQTSLYREIKKMKNRLEKAKEDALALTFENQVIKQEKEQDRAKYQKAMKVYQAQYTKETTTLKRQADSYRESLESTIIQMQNEMREGLELSVKRVNQLKQDLAKEQELRKQLQSQLDELGIDYTDM